MQRYGIYEVAKIFFFWNHVAKNLFEVVVFKSKAAADCIGWVQPLADRQVNRVCIEILNVVVVVAHSDLGPSSPYTNHPFQLPNACNSKHQLKRLRQLVHMRLDRTLGWVADWQRLSPALGFGNVRGPFVLDQKTRGAGSGTQHTPQSTSPARGRGGAITIPPRDEMEMWSKRKEAGRQAGHLQLTCR
jgi:hypothetical protein